MTKPSSTKSPASVKKPKKVSSAVTLGSKPTKRRSPSQRGQQDLPPSTRKDTSPTLQSSGDLKRISLDNLVTIPEYVIRQAADYLNEAFPDEPNNYNVVLEEADAYHKADMTPVFLLDRESMMIIVAAEETLGKVLH
jgi:hypothetical protein